MFDRINQRFVSNISRMIEDQAARSGRTKTAILGEVGMDRQSLWRIQQGRRDPQLSTIVKLAQAVGLNEENFSEVFK